MDFEMSKRRAVSRAVQVHVRRTLLAAAALVGLNAYTQMASAQVIIDGGATETVPFTQPSPWNIANALTVGDTSTGTLNIQAGAQMSTSSTAMLGDKAGSHGIVTLEDAGTSWIATGPLTIANLGHADLQLSSGAHLTSNLTYLANQTGSRALVTVDGDNTLWTTGPFNIGLDGLGILSISNGGRVDSPSALVGAYPTGNGDVSIGGVGSTWTIANTLTIGGSGGGSGTVNVSNGGLLASGDAFVGTGGGNAIAGVSGAGSRWNINGDFVIGNGGTNSQAELLVEDGGVVDTTGNAFLAYANDSTGAAYVQGANALWNVQGNQVFIGGDATNSAFGALILKDGGTVTVGGGTGIVNVAQSVGYGSWIAIGGSVFLQSGNPSAAPGYLNAGSVSLGQYGVHTSANYEFAPVIEGFGMVQQFAGTTHLTGNSGLFFGETAIYGGTLFVDGALGGTVTVMDDGALGGSGDISGDVILTTGNPVLLGESGKTLAMHSLVLNPTSTVDVALGAPGGATLFDLKVDLTLDGTLNVTNAGGFGAGVYRLFDYDGVLTDNGLDIGSMPLGTSGVLQTSVPEEINLVVQGGVLPETQFWNGNATTADGSIKGGAGKWTANAASTNWTDAQGTTANEWGGHFAVFQGTPGTVTVDASAGPITATGMQFIGQGWSVAGDPVTLTGAATVRVGNGADSSASDSATINSVLTGSGSLIKDDLGTLILSGANTYTGGTSVHAGTLAVNGVLGAVDVRSGARLRGIGTIGGLTVAGTVAPGNSIGTLSVSGDAAFSSGSTYEVEVNAAGDSDRLAVTGVASVSGGSVQVLAGNGSYAPATTYTILTADGGVNGTFDGVTSNLAFLVPTLSYDANRVFLTLSRNGVDFTSVGVTPNQIATGRAVDALGWGHDVYNAAFNLSAAEARAAFDRLAGEVHTASKVVLLEDSRFVRDAGISRLRAAFDGVAASGAPVLTYDGKNQPQASAADTENFATWAQAYGSWGRWNGDGNAARVDRDTGGALLGADAFVLGNWRIGALAGFSESDFDVNDRSSFGTSDNYHLGVYAGSQWGKLSQRAGAIRTWSDVATSRNVAYTGFADRAHATYDGGTTQAFGELGYALRFGGLALEPYAGVAYVNVHAAPFAEEGGAAALAGPGSTIESTFGSVGLRVANHFKLGKVDVTAQGSAGWLHGFGEAIPHSSLSFEGSSSEFTIAGVPLARDTAAIDAGLDFRLSGRSVVGLTYGGRFGSGLSDSSVRVTFEMAF